MKICILGYSGFLGSHLSNYLSKKFTIKKIDLRKLPQKNSDGFDKFLDEIVYSNIIINCAASIRPNSANDFFINQDFPHFLQTYIKKKKIDTFLIHISTNNVLINERKDPYTISKKIAEKKLENEKVVILRLPLLYYEINNVLQPAGNLKKIFNYLSLRFPYVYPMIYPGHIYEPLEINKLMTFIENLILKKEKSENIYNIAGNEKKKLWDIFDQIAKHEKKKVLKINIEKIEKLIPNFIKSHINKSQNIFQQLISIDHTKFNEKKTFL